MIDKKFDLHDLERILREGAGASKGIDAKTDILDIEFEELGYESLAILETIGRIEREFDIVMEDATLAEATTPRALIAAVNAHFVGVGVEGS
ncbi:acyl carrier protein [Nocardia noduli]|uniref:acyl carrier protein n=1 Tax=Nocardia noduli TaxID=2815722 RepID=UPI001C23D326|nr:acyl carrier protein [Nocardia noduli]